MRHQLPYGITKDKLSKSCPFRCHIIYAQVHNIILLSPAFSKDMVFGFPSFHMSVLCMLPYSVVCTLCAHLLLQFYSDYFETLQMSLNINHALKICISFGYSPQINFCHFFSQFELTILQCK